MQELDLSSNKLFIQISKLSSWGKLKSLKVGWGRHGRGEGRLAWHVVGWGRWVEREGWVAISCW